MKREGAGNKKTTARSRTDLPIIIVVNHPPFTTALRSVYPYGRQEES